jgi:hypothetical protein
MNKRRLKRKMKCIVYWEFSPEDVDKVIAKTVKAQEIREKEPDRFPTYLFPPQYTGPCQGFSIVEMTQDARALDLSLLLQVFT